MGVSVVIGVLIELEAHLTITAELADSIEPKVFARWGGSKVIGTLQLSNYL